MNKIIDITYDTEFIDPLEKIKEYLEFYKDRSRYRLEFFFGEDELTIRVYQIRRYYEK